MYNENKYDDLFKKYAKKNDVDWLLLKAQVKQESRFNPSAVSPSGAKGLSQFMDKAWLEWEDETPGIQNKFKDYDPFNPEDSIRVQAAYMSWLIKQFNGHIKKALAAYNWGIGNVKRLLSVSDFEIVLLQMPKETQKYLMKIDQYYKEYLQKNKDANDT